MALFQKKRMTTPVVMSDEGSMKYEVFESWGNALQPYVDWQRNLRSIAGIALRPSQV